MGKEYRRRFEEMVRGLREHPDIQVRQARIADPAPAATVSELARTCADTMPSCLVELYGEMDGFSVEWVHTLTPGGPRGDLDTGTINIRPVAEVFGPGPARLFLDEDERFRPVRPFDIFTSEACAALLQAPDTTVRDEVHFHIFGEGTLRTGHTTEAYLERALASRGTWSWISTLCRDLQEMPEVADFRRLAPLLFEDYDDDLFRPGSP